MSALAAIPVPPRAAAAVLCTHCDQPVPPGLVRGAAAADGFEFCCSGCATAHAIIHGHGLDRFYRLRTRTGGAAQPVGDAADFAAFDHADFLAARTTALAGGLRRVEFVLEGLHCAACVWLVERLPRLCPGVAEARVSLPRRGVALSFDPAAVPLSRVAATLARLGYVPHPRSAEAGRAVARKEERALLANLAAAGCLAANGMMAAVAIYLGEHYHGMEDSTLAILRWATALCGLLAVAWPGRVYFRSAFRALRAGLPSLDMPIALGLAVGAAAGTVATLTGRGDLWFDTLGMLVFLLLVGRYLRFRQQRRAEECVALLHALTPASARRVEGGETGGVETEVPVEALRTGDLLAVRPGERIPADGTVVAGEALTGEALLTGEPDLRPIRPGDAVLAGATLEGAPITLRATACGESARAGRLMAEVERALARRPALVERADRYGRVFSVVVLLLAAATFLGWWWAAGPAAAADRAVALLVIACPCALGLAAPLTLAAGIGAVARASILVKGGAVLERLGGRGGLLVLDKTGTLTLGRPVLVDAAGDPGALALGAALERVSLHPLAKALRTAKDDPALPMPQDVRETAGGGLTGQVAGRRVCVGSPAFVEASGAALPPALAANATRLAAEGHALAAVAVDGEVRAVAAFGDPLRPEAAPLLERLRARGWRMVLLSGDHEAAVQRVASALGLAEARAACSPEDKLAFVQARRAQRAAGDGPVVMVGDGINDAAALAAAEVGVAVHGGAETALAAADAYIARPGLGGLDLLLAQARRTRRVLFAAWMLGLAYNVSFVSLAMAGVLKPWMAAVLMPVSSISVVALAFLGAGRRAGGDRAPQP